MRIHQIITEGVAGPEKCWPGHRKVGTKPGTGKNAGKRVNDCEKIKKNNESKVQELSADTLKSYRQKASDNASALSAVGYQMALDSDELHTWSKRDRGVDKADKRLAKIKDTNKKSNKSVKEGLDQQNYDLTPVYPNYKVLVGQRIGEKNDRYVFRILSAELKPGQGQTPQISYALENKTRISIEKSRSKNCKVVSEGALNEFYRDPDDDEESPLDNYPCYDCGSTIYMHHTKLCDLAEDDAILDLPSKPGLQHWTGEIPKGLKPIPGLQESFNGEYDDEAGMAEGNLHTLSRAVNGLLDTIDDNDNLPEWCQEKIAKAEMMLVSVWDYLQSQKEQGIDPSVAEGLTPDQMFDIIEEMVERVAAEHGVDPELIWEEFESVDDVELFESAAWRRKEGKSKAGGLNAKGVASYRRENPGSKLQTAVTTKPSKLKKGSKAAKRRKSFCARMGGVKGPMKKPNGKPTRKALALRKWNC